MTCTVSVAPATFMYEVGDAGRMLTVAAGTADEQVLERVGTPSGMLQGTWILGDNSTAGLTVHGEIRFDAAQVTVTSLCSARGKSVKATASSPATITATTVTVLQSDSDVQYID